jgi:hypothetical protein
MKSEQTEKSGENALPGASAGEGELHKPPSMLWFVIPLGLLLLYGVLTR